MIVPEEEQERHKHVVRCNRATTTYSLALPKGPSTMILGNTFRIGTPSTSTLSSLAPGMDVFLRDFDASHPRAAPKAVVQSPTILKFTDKKSSSGAEVRVNGCHWKYDISGQLMKMYWPALAFVFSFLI